MPLENLLDHLKQRAEHQLHRRISDDHVLESDYGGALVAPNQDYLAIRVAEMFLKYKSEYWRDFTPISVVSTSLAYGGRYATFPFVVGPELLKDVEAYASGEDISLRNTRAAGPFPFLGGDVGMFVGLFRLQLDDAAKRLLRALGQVANALGIGALTHYTAITGIIMDGLYELLDCKQTEYRTGDRDVFQDTGARALRDGYFAFVNCAEDALGAQSLWVEDGHLMQETAAGKRRRMTDFDYCLVRIERVSQRQDYTTLGFNETWKKAHERLGQGDGAMAHALFVECCRQIADSPDLTPEHAQCLIQAYTARFLKAVEMFAGVHKLKPQRSPAAFRGDSTAVPTARQNLHRSTVEASHAGFRDEDLSGLTDLRDNWDRIPHLGLPEVAMTERELGDQIQAISQFRKTAPKPRELAAALTIASIAKN